MAINDVSNENTAAAKAEKALGNTCFKSGDLNGAVKHYTKAIELDNTDHTFFSNRAMVYLKQEKFEEAAADGRACTTIKPDFIKGWHRLCSALKELGQYEEAHALVVKGLKTPGVAENSDLIALRDELAPRAERSRRASIKQMGPAAAAKAEGNDCFKKGMFEEAAKKYSVAIKKLPADPTADAALEISCYNNRAACYQQISNFRGVIEDTSHVLELDDKNIKAFIRRGLAFEGMERYRSALQDMRSALVIDPRAEVANKAQHRLGMAVQRLKRAKAEERK